jgi:nitrogen regulatory protein PII-like uncharacterized protein
MNGELPIIRELNERGIEGFLALKRRGLSTDPDSFVASLEDDPATYPDRVCDRLTRASSESGDTVPSPHPPAH